MWVHEYYLILYEIVSDYLLFPVINVQNSSIIRFVFLSVLSEIKFCLHSKEKRQVFLYLIIVCAV